MQKKDDARYAFSPTVIYKQNWNPRLLMKIRPIEQCHRRCKRDMRGPAYGQACCGDVDLEKQKLPSVQHSKQWITENVAVLVSTTILAFNILKHLQKDCQICGHCHYLNRFRTAKKNELFSKI